MKASRELKIIATISILASVLISLLIQPVYAMFCAANITSDPSGADVYVDGAYKGKTPYFHFVGNPFDMNLTVKKEGYETWSQAITVGEEVKNVNVVLTALGGPGSPPKGAATVTTTTVTTTITTATPTTITITTIQTITTISATTITSTEAPRTTTVTSSALAQTVTTTNEVTQTQTIGLPSEVTYAAVGVAAIASIAAAVLATRRK